MVEITIPLPTENVWHFLYITTDPLTGEWYGGKRSSKRHPLKDPYLGSGDWVRAHPNRERLTREVVAFFPSAEETYIAEAEMITWATIASDPMCMNRWEGGRGCTPEAVAHRRENTDWVANHGASMKVLHADPDYRRKLHDGLNRWFADPRRPAVVAAALEARSHNRNWRPNLAAALRRVTQTEEWKTAQLVGAQQLAVVFVTVNGTLLTLGDACRETGASYKLALYRRSIGWPDSDLLLPPSRSKVNPECIRAPAPNGRHGNLYTTYNGERMKLQDACVLAGVPYPTAFDRLRRGWPESDWLLPSRKRRTTP